MAVERDLAGVGQRRDQREGLGEHVDRDQRLQRDRCLVALVAGHLEQLVDEAEQMAARPQDVVGGFALIVGQLVVQLEQLAEPDDGVQRSSQLVAHA